MREVPLIKDYRLAGDDLLAVPNAPTLVPFRVADKHALDYVLLQFVLKPKFSRFFLGVSLTIVCDSQYLSTRMLKPEFSRLFLRVS